MVPLTRKALTLFSRGSATPLIQISESLLNFLFENDSLAKSFFPFLVNFFFFIETLGVVWAGAKVDCFSLSLTLCGPEEGDDNSLPREKVESWVCLPLQI